MKGSSLFNGAIFNCNPIIITSVSADKMDVLHVYRTFFLPFVYMAAAEFNRDSQMHAV